MDKFQTKSNIKKFRKHFIIGGGGILLLLLVLAYFSGSKEAPVVQKPVVTQEFTAVTQPTSTAGEVLTQHLTQFENNQQKVNQQYLARTAELESENAAYKAQLQAIESSAINVNQKLATLNTAKANSSAAAKSPPPKPQKMVFEEDISSDRSSFGSDESSSMTDLAMMSTENRNNASSKKEIDKNITTYIPSNSFVKGILISSLSANTGGNASQQPTPVLINITDIAQLPNLFRFNVRSCLVGGSGYGDLSTERVKIVLANLSCVLKSGKAIDIPVSGYVAGEDAKAGLRGMVVTHSGSLVAKASLAGALQGIGTLGQAMGQTQTITPLGGVTTTVSPSQALYAGGGGAVSQVGSTLSQYYLNMLNAISPSIEVSAGRHITVIFTQGVELKLPANENFDANSQPLPLD